MMEIILSNGTRYLTNQPILFAAGHLSFKSFIKDDHDQILDCDDVDRIIVIEGADTALRLDSNSNTQSY